MWHLPRRLQAQGSVAGPLDANSDSSPLPARVSSSRRIPGRTSAGSALSSGPACALTGSFRGCGFRTPGPAQATRVRRVSAQRTRARPNPTASRSRAARGSGTRIKTVAFPPARRLGGRWLEAARGFPASHVGKRRVVEVAPIFPEQSAYALARYSHSRDPVVDSLEWGRGHGSEKYLHAAQRAEDLRFQQPAQPAARSPSRTLGAMLLQHGPGAGPARRQAAAGPWPPRPRRAGAWDSASRPRGTGSGPARCATDPLPPAPNAADSRSPASAIPGRCASDLGMPLADHLANCVCVTAVRLSPAAEMLAIMF